jgi:hypothetical protein
VSYIIWFRRRLLDFTCGKVKRKQLKEKYIGKVYIEVSKVFNGDKVPLSPIVISTRMKS